MAQTGHVAVAAVDLSVPVTDGLAAISLTGEASAFSPADTELLFAQLAWTLRQDPDVDAFTLAIDGRPVRTVGGETRIPVAVGDQLDPVGFQTDSLLHGLRDGLLVSGTPGSLDPVGGVMGRVDLGVRSVAVDLLGTRVAAVSEAGGTVLLAPLTDGEGVTPREDDDRGRRHRPAATGLGRPRPALAARPHGRWRCRQVGAGGGQWRAGRPGGHRRGGA